MRGTPANTIAKQTGNDGGAQRCQYDCEVNAMHQPFTVFATIFELDPIMMIPLFQSPLHRVQLLDIDGATVTEKHD